MKVAQDLGERGGSNANPGLSATMHPPHHVRQFPSALDPEAVKSVRIPTALSTGGGGPSAANDP